MERMIFTTFQSIGSNGNSTGSVYESMSHSITISLQALDKFCGITPTSQRGQTVYMFIMLLIPLIPIFALITQVSKQGINVKKPSTIIIILTGNIPERDPAERHHPAEGGPGGDGRQCGAERRDGPAGVQPAAGAQRDPSPHLHHKPGQRER